MQLKEIGSVRVKSKNNDVFYSAGIHKKVLMALATINKVPSWLSSIYVLFPNTKHNNVHRFTLNLHSLKIKIVESFP